MLPHELDYRVVLLVSDFMRMVPQKTRVGDLCLISLYDSHTLLYSQNPYNTLGVEVSGGVWGNGEGVGERRLGLGWLEGGEGELEVGGILIEVGSAMRESSRNRYNKQAYMRTAIILLCFRIQEFPFL